MKARRCNSSSRNEENISETDLIYEILSRAPAKSIARFRCLSKEWDSTLCSPYFTEQFFNVSSSRPRLLFTCVKDGEMFFFSSSPPNPVDPSSPLSAEFHMSFPINNPGEIARPVRGLVCGLNQQPFKGKKFVTLPSICNPSTGQSLRLPTVKTFKKQVKSFLLYDPVSKQFKVLCHSVLNIGIPPWFHEQQVLTLAEKKPSWRQIDCSVIHNPLFVSHPQYDGICINGVFYYLAFVCGGGKYPDVICFDVRSESFLCRRHVPGMRKNFMSHIESALVNHKGKLALLQPDGPACTGINLWVLHIKDDGYSHSHKWTCHTYDFTLPWSEIVAETRLRFVGTTEAGEIVMSPHCITDSFYLVYCNPKTKTVTKVAIRGMEAFKTWKAYTFLNHVEDLKLRI